MADLSIDTSAPGYQNALVFLEQLKTRLQPRMRFLLSKGLSPQQRRTWLQADPLLKKFLKLSLKVVDRLEEFRSDIEQP